MDFSETPEQRSFRAEIDSWLVQKMERAPDAALRMWFSTVEPTDDVYEFAKEVQDELVEKGWLTVAWPKEYGGAGFSIVEQAIFSEEMYRHRVPHVYGIGIDMVGPALITHGTAEQKARLLPPIARGELVIWQCFTEPEAGSDLASLKTRAVRDGDDYIVDGTKMFVGDSHPADYFYTFARTNPDAPKHAGISAFLIDAKSPGVSITPLSPIDGTTKNALYFDSVRVPKINLVGEENRGWYLAMSSLRLERSGSNSVVGLQRAFEEFVAYCRDTIFNGRPLIDDPLVEQRLGDLATDLATMRLLTLRNLWMQSNEMSFTLEPSQTTLLGKQFLPKFGKYALEITKHVGILKADSRWTAMQGAIEYLERFCLRTHGGGTPEIHQNIIAQRGLGLPRS